MDKADKKRIFRQKAFKIMKQLPINNYKKDKKVIKTILKEIKKEDAKDIMLFIPLKTEPNIAPLIKLLRQRGYNLYVPFMKGKSFKLVKYRLPLEIKKFGIKEPKNSYFNIKKVDIAIVPIIGIDKTLKRIGFGKGMYDRFYEKFGKNIKKTLFIQRDIFYTDETITDSYDIKADKIVANSIKEIKI